ncbi:YaaC family protein [Alicyclobacillus ferrooxydans]|nr:YaaC family protein [Alicyclobacillus ferrooxydans]
MADWGEVADELWSFVEYWRSENYMAKVISKFHPDEPNHRVYTAASNSSACARQASAYEASAMTADISVRPLLLYYAYLNWIKALLHAIDVSYPSEAAVLQHGVSVRRTKRVSYHLPSEMVYIYKQGVLQSAAERAGIKLPQRLLLGDVLGMLTPIQHLMTEFYPKFQHLYPIQAEENKIAWRNGILVPRTIAANNGQTVEEWITDLLRSDSEGHMGQALASQDTAADESLDEFTSFVRSVRQAPLGYLRLPRSILQHPWMFKIEAASGFAQGIRALPSVNATESHTLATDTRLVLANRAPLAGWMLHFIVLYCLSALVRYNPLEWSDILRWHNEPDALLIETYLCHAPSHMRLNLAELFRAMVTTKEVEFQTEGHAITSGTLD